MRSRTKRCLTFRIESLEDRNAPSGGLSGGLHNVGDLRREHAGQKAQVQQISAHKNGLDDAPGHHAGDDNLPRHSGQDQRPGHNANDDLNRNRHGR